MKKGIFTLLLFACIITLNGQTSPAITSWLQNTTETGTFYMEGNSTPVDHGFPYNCQKVEYSDDNVYVHTYRFPAYPIGPFIDGTPNFDNTESFIYRFPLNPTENTGPASQTTPGNIGVFINGASLYDFRDDVAWDNDNQTLCGGFLNTDCPGGMGAQQDWNRDAVLAEIDQFDCSKGHPFMGAYHHHQNPSAYKLDLTVINDICDIYDADGLYQIDSTQHSPLLGFAYDGFPIYGAYGYKNTDGTGGITRIKSGYQIRNITERVNGPEIGLVVNYTAGPPQNPFSFSDTLNLGYFREDYEHIDTGEPDVLDEHNGRFCITPEYPNGTYAYFLTVDENWNSAYPYAVGPEFYGEVGNNIVNNINEATTTYGGTTSTNDFDVAANSITVFPNPATDLIAVQVNGLVREDLQVELFSITGQRIASKSINAGSTIAYFDTQTVYAGTYILKIYNDNFSESRKVIISK